MVDKKKSEATVVASSRSRGGKFDKDKTKQQQGTAQELPEWAKDMPDEIVVKTWEID